jgi:hypothetical protein
MTILRRHVVAWWQALVSPETAGQLVLDRDGSPGFNTFLAIGIATLYGIYGITMGIYQGALPALISGLKLPFLYLFTGITCFPAFYVLNCLLGPKLEFSQCVRLLLIAVSTNAAALASYAPFSLFFTLTTSTAGYGFLVLMHVAVFALSALASLVVIGLMFRATAREVGRPLRPMFVVAWGFLYAFVGTQTSWILRPWVGTQAIEYVPIRPLGGSFIEAVWELVRNLMRS